MARITGSYPDDLDLLIEGTVEAGLFGGNSDALRESVREYFVEHDIDYVIMGSHGRSGISRLVLGSVAEQVLRQSPIPVTIVR